MKKTDVQIKGITYTVHSTTDAGLRDAIRQLRRSIKRMTSVSNETTDTNETKEEE
tara:strand:- start:4514 stop:4678 length:165 start_codon:yes stop_codon:yes gene_type:complete